MSLPSLLVIHGYVILQQNPSSSLHVSGSLLSDMLAADVQRLREAQSAVRKEDEGLFLLKQTPAAISTKLGL